LLLFFFVIATASSSRERHHQQRTSSEREGKVDRSKSALHDLDQVSLGLDNRETNNAFVMITSPSSKHQ
jgi:hypothetical protein